MWKKGPYESIILSLAGLPWNLQFLIAFRFSYLDSSLYVSLIRRDAIYLVMESLLEQVL
jgi:hypothetical protein